jgi:hypothetical protein
LGCLGGDALGGELGDGGTHRLHLDDDVVEASAEVGRIVGGIVDQLDGDEVVVGEFEHGQVPERGLGDAPDHLVAHRGVEPERPPQIGHTQADVQGPHRFPSVARGLVAAHLRGVVGSSARSGSQPRP